MQPIRPRGRSGLIDVDLDILAGSSVVDRLAERVGGTGHSLARVIRLHAVTRDDRSASNGLELLSGVDGRVITDVPALRDHAGDLVTVTREVVFPLGRALRAEVFLAAEIGSALLCIREKSVLTLNSHVDHSLNFEAPSEASQHQFTPHPSRADRA